MTFHGIDQKHPKIEGKKVPDVEGQVNLAYVLYIWCGFIPTVSMYCIHDHTKYIHQATKVSSQK